MSDRFEFGDQVCLPSRPEWGLGSVVKTVDEAVRGEPCQRVTIRFANAGMKVLNTQVAALERVVATEPVASQAPSALQDADRLRESDWLSDLGDRKVDELMHAIPEPAKDPFRSIAERLERTANLYRFDRDGGSLIDWAVAQTGLDDPLSRFTRQELEQRFDRWAHERDAHFGRLLVEARGEVGLVRRILESGPPAARAFAQRSGRRH